MIRRKIDEMVKLQVGRAFYRTWEITEKVSLKSTKTQVLRLASLAQDDKVLGWMNASTHKQLLFLG